jgi:hypothetical protein
MKYANPILVACLATLSWPLPAQEALEAKPGPAGKQHAKFVSIDLQGQTNHKLKDSLNTEGKDNSLRNVPQGPQDFCDIRFQVGPGFIRLGGKLHTTLPARADGIAVDSLCQKLHILQGTEFGGVGEEGHPFFIKDATAIGHYLIHYADGATKEVPIVYGEDVRDWWNWDQSKKVTRGHLAWTGKTDNSEENNVTIRLYVTTWVNPKPDIKVEKIDFISNFLTAASPFCIAITAEQK